MTVSIVNTLINATEKEFIILFPNEMGVYDKEEKFSNYNSVPTEILDSEVYNFKNTFDTVIIFLD